MYDIKFSYVDGKFDYAPNKSIKWKRIKINEIDDRIGKPAKHYNAFVTVQQYCQPIQSDGELQYAPIFFDLDDKDKPERALEDAKKIVEYFKKMRMEDECIRLYFSGFKGFHVLLNPLFFSVRPREDLTYVYKEIARYLKEFLKLNTLDISVYSIRRMLRIPNTLHNESGLYKIEIFPKELCLGMAEIKKLSIKPRPLLYNEEQDNVNFDTDAKDWYRRFEEIYDSEKVLKNLRPHKNVRKTEKYPACVEDLLKNSIRMPDTRNRAAMVLASYFKDIGWEKEKTTRELIVWAKKIPHSLSDWAGNERHLEANTRSVIESIYADEKYHFACQFIRSLGGGVATILCDFDKCFATSKEDQAPKQLVNVHLSEASRPEYVGATLKTTAIVSGKDMSPYEIPKIVDFSCDNESRKESKRCLGCRLVETGGFYQLNTALSDDSILGLLQCAKASVDMRLKEKANVSKNCNLLNLMIKEWASVEDVRLVPPADTQDMEDREYVYRRGFYVGHGLKSNVQYEIEIVPAADPWSRYCVNVFSKVKPSDDSINAFELTPKIVDLLKVFQLREQQTIKEKLDEIYNDLEANVFKLWGRRNMITAFDLAYHSVLSFHFNSDTVRKGWVECMVVGDSGTGKSTLAGRMIGHYGMGFRVNAEAAGRTGLVYSLSTNESGRWMISWGDIPRNDRRLLVLDEFSGLSPDAIAELSDVRQSGIASVHKIIEAQTTARTRLIFLSNPRTGQPLSSFNYGCEAIWTIIPKSEDIRRLDFALAVCSKEIPDAIINRFDTPDVKHVYTSGICKLLLLWCWSRRPENIVFDKGVEDEIIGGTLYLCKKYDPAIPLVEPGDQRLKVARLSVAIAARLFSTKTGDDVWVKKEHVMFIIDYLQSVYDANGFGYDIVSRNKKASNLEDPEQRLKVKVELMKLQAWEALKNVNMLSVDRFSRMDLMAYLDCDKIDFTQCWLFLTKNKLVESYGSGVYVKSGTFISLLKEMEKN